MKTCILLLYGCLLHTLFAAAQTTAPAALHQFPLCGHYGNEPIITLRNNRQHKSTAFAAAGTGSNATPVATAGYMLMPYWLFNHPKLQLQQYLNSKPATALLQSLSVYTAFTGNEQPAITHTTAGFQCTLYNGRPSSAHTVDGLLLQLKDYTTATVLLENLLFNHVFNNLPEAADSVTAAIKAASIQPTVSDSLQKTIQQHMGIAAPNSITTFLHTVWQYCMNQMQYLQQKIYPLLILRKGFIITAAGAYCRNTDTRVASAIKSMQLQVSHHQFAFIFRWQQHLKDSTLTTADIAVQYQQLTPFITLTAEAAIRYYKTRYNHNSTQAFTWRFAIQGSMQLQKDISLTLCFGKSFDTPAIQQQGLFTIAGITYTLFSKKIQPVL